MFDEIVLASGNGGKLKEFGRWFGSRGIRVLPQAEFNVPECPEPHATFIENAIAKARHAAKHSGRPARRRRCRNHRPAPAGRCVWRRGGLWRWRFQ